MNKIHCTLALSLLVGLSSAYPAVYTSTATGGNWSDGGTWTGGVPVNDNQVEIVSGASVTLNSYYYSNQTPVLTLSGALTVANGGTFQGNAGGNTQQAVLFANSSAALNIESGGTVSGLRLGVGSAVVANIAASGTLSMISQSAIYGYVASTISGYNVTLNSGGVLNSGAVGATVASAPNIFDIGTSSTNANWIFTLNVAGGAFNYTGPATATTTPVARNLSTTRGTVALNISSGAFNYNGVNLGWTANVKNNFNWTGGKLENVYGIVDQTMNNEILADFGAAATQAVDINTGATAQNWNVGTGALSDNAGTIQFDVFSMTLNDSDRITGTGPLTLNSGVVLNLGWKGGAVDPTTWDGMTIKLFDLADYSGLSATVADAVWNDGTTDYTVSFDTTNLNVNGTVTVVPEPSTVALSLLAGLGLFLARRKLAA